MIGDASPDGLFDPYHGPPAGLDRLKEGGPLSDQACELWDEIMTYRRFIPTPFSAAEMGIMFVMVTRQGTQIAVDFLTSVRDEVRERAADGIGVIENEKIRLFWDNIPLWYNMGLFNYFEKLGGVVVAETYSAAWSMRMDPDKPIESLACKSLVSYPMVSCVSVKQTQGNGHQGLPGLSHRRGHAPPEQVLRAHHPGPDGHRSVHWRRNSDVPSVIIDGDHMDDAISPWPSSRPGSTPSWRCCWRRKG